MPRPSLAYAESPKTGSGSLRLILPFVNPKCHIKRKKWDRGPGHSEDVGCYQTMGARGSPSVADRARHFVIGSTREPCDLLLSRLAYKSKAFKSKAKSKASTEHKTMSLVLKGVTGSKLLDALNQSGLLDYPTKHFLDHYSTRPNIDCWVHTGDFAGSLRSCLKQFEKQGGHVNWHETSLAAVLAHKERTPGVAAGGKNSPRGAQKKDHEPCIEAFGNLKVRRAMQHANAPLYEAFGWTGCCNTKSWQPKVVALARMPDAGGKDMAGVGRSTLGGS